MAAYGCIGEPYGQQTSCNMPQEKTGNRGGKEAASKSCNGSTIMLECSHEEKRQAVSKRNPKAQWMICLMRVALRGGRKDGEHSDIWKYHQSISKVRAEVLGNLVVWRQMPGSQLAMLTTELQGTV